MYLELQAVLNGMFGDFQAFQRWRVHIQLRLPTLDLLQAFNRSSSFPGSIRRSDQPHGCHGWQRCKFYSLVPKRSVIFPRWWIQLFLSIFYFHRYYHIFSNRLTPPASFCLKVCVICRWIFVTISLHGSINGPYGFFSEWVVGNSGHMEIVTVWR